MKLLKHLFRSIVLRGAEVLDVGGLPYRTDRMIEHVIFGNGIGRQFGDNLQLFSC